VKAGLAWNRNPVLCFPSGWDYGREPWAPGSYVSFRLVELVVCGPSGVGCMCSGREFRGKSAQGCGGWKMGTSVPRGYHTVIKAA
jgi:hypothetical protein